MSEIRCGQIAIVGRPNVGKSTLLNALIGEKLSIVSRRAQTTRHRIMGILTRTDTDTQYVFVDTPGFQNKYSNALNQVMNRGVRQALADVDVVLFVVEAGRFDDRDRAVRQLVPADCPVIIVVNKIDQLKDKSRLLPFLAELAREGDFTAIVPISATRGAQLDSLLAETRKHLPKAQFLFGEDEITDRSERFLAAEYIREKLFRLIGDELPYAATVEVEKFAVEGGDGSLRRISAAIVVDRAGHKAIIIGSGGETVKRIASEARQDMERMFGGPVFLEVFVKVKSGWADDERLLKTLGYE
ncbi:membrane-associated, 16S rRNA-binding GTPase [Candidatus Accumulibacter aalborgensis]|uniref:GTPase Era n=1 Tax=Candidatus Accumulibacter aalborgensis TaxID=1860102 RepID=A0A1A8XGL5_9PROT|nr:GTPase Era [Candidatus Accumulibacter aalborgensis]SBT04324.1 membrane-associated, 16S rRNA-binding GTPase [Candidatus Accumulibacter aalborgensis]